MKTLWKWFLIFCVAWVVDFFLFPVSFRFIPPNINSKMILAIIGAGLYALKIIRTRNHEVQPQFLMILFIATLYSIVNMLSTDFNGKADYSYANYITSAITWLGSGYAALETIRFVHGKVTFSLMTSYFAAVCATQCILSQIFDMYDAPVVFFESIFVMYSQATRDLGRLFGIGCGLDPAGTRFAVVLIMIACTLVTNRRIAESTRSVTWLLISYIIIIGLGNIISRTTVTGAAFSVLVLALSAGVQEMKLRREYFKIYSSFFILLLIFVPIAVILYNTDEGFYNQFRYGFEGFFSLFEKGEWQTDSNDVLATMWKWPTTDMGWLIGYGEFGGFRFGTDIGYCRFVLYSGVIGTTIFSSMFVYSAIFFWRKYPKYWAYFALLLAMHFVIWLKVATDLFQFWAILYVMTERDWLLSINPELEDEDEEEEEEELQPAYTPRSPQMIYSSNNAR